MVVIIKWLFYKKSVNYNIILDIVSRILKIRSSSYINNTKIILKYGTTDYVKYIIYTILLRGAFRFIKNLPINYY